MTIVTDNILTYVSNTTSLNDSDVVELANQIDYVADMLCFCYSRVDCVDWLEIAVNDHITRAQVEQVVESAITFISNRQQQLRS